jgi:hypothetical protein
MLHCGHHHEIPSQNCGGFSPTISPSNLAGVPVVTYDYQLCLLSRGHIQLPAQQNAHGLLSGSCTSGTAGHRLQPKILDTIGSLQQQIAQETHTPYQICLYHSRLKRGGTNLKKLILGTNHIFALLHYVRHAWTRFDNLSF